MKAAFCHNNTYRTNPAGQVFSAGQFGSEAWSRYLEVFESLTVVGHCEALQKQEDIRRLNLATRSGVSFCFVPKLSGPVRFFSRRREANRKLASILEQTDVVIVRGAGEISQIAARLGRRIGKPVAAEVVACAWNSLWHYGNWQGKVYAPINFLRTRLMISRVPFAIYVTESFLQHRYPNRGHTAGVSNVQISEPRESVLESRLRKIESGAKPAVIGLIGSLKHRHKGLHVALRALARVRKVRPGIEFRVLGQGEVAPWQAEAARADVADITQFYGTLPSGQPVLDWLDDIDLYIQPSLTEGIPRAVIEAMSRACPVLASSAGGARELLPDECLHKPGDAQQLAEQLLCRLDDRQWLADAARRNFEVSRGYSQEILAARRYAFWRAFADYAARVKAAE